MSFLDNVNFKNAIYLASPDLLVELLKWKQGKIFEDKKINRLRISLFKYITRICTRCTPFGAFSAVGTGKISEDNNLIKIESFYSHNRLNLGILNQIVSLIEKDKDLNSHLLFYNNSTIINIKNKIRYYEVINNKVEMNEIEFNSVLKEILVLSKRGIKKEKLIQELGLLFPEYNDQIESYIEEIISNQLLVSELNFNIEVDPLEKILCFFRENEILHPLYLKLIEVKETILKIDLNSNNDEFLEILSSILRSLGITYDEKKLFHSDTYVNFSYININEKIINDLRDTLLLINNLNYPPIYNLEYLVSNIKDVYGEDSSINLYKILTNEFNIKYKEFNNLTPIVNNLKISNKNEETDNTIKINSSYKFLHEKILSFNSQKIKLKKSDFTKIQNEISYKSGHDVVDTFSTVLEKIIEDGEEKIILNFTGGSSAINLISRFYYHDNISKLIDVISEFEINKNKDAIYADFCHLPLDLDRGYVVFRKKIKDFNIQFLNNEFNDKTIEVEDLYLKTEDNKIVLFSKKYNKEIKISIPNTHNTDLFNNVPLYQFIGDLRKSKRYGMIFSLNDLLHFLKYIPRIEYNNIILQKETWLLDKSEIDFLISQNINSEDLSFFLEKKKLPEILVLEEEDQKFVFSFKNKISYECFKDLIKNKKNIILTENFIKSDILSDNGSFKNEIIIPFLNLS